MRLRYKFDCMFYVECRRYVRQHKESGHSSLKYKGHGIHPCRKIAKMACFNTLPCSCFVFTSHLNYYVITHTLYGFVKTDCFIFFSRGCIIMHDNFVKWLIEDCVLHESISNECIIRNCCDWLRELREIRSWRSL